MHPEVGASALRRGIVLVGEQGAIIEREFQTAIEARLDIAGILIEAAAEPMPETNAGRFGRLGDLEILSPETAERMRRAAGFRNVLTPADGDAVVYQYLQNELAWFVTYLRGIREFLDEPRTRDE